LRPNGYPNGHVRDRRDIMDYRAMPPDENVQVTVQLDPGRDDYWGHKIARCADVSDSHYLDSNPPSSTPQGSAEPGTGLTAQGAPRLVVRGIVKGVETDRDSVKCSAKLGKRSLRVLFARYAGRVASCGLAVGARRGFVTGKITARSGTAAATRSFQLRA
jgi:hypothetical protein